MNKKIINLLMGALVVGTFGACDESEYDIDNLFPSQYEKILNIRDSGEQNYKIFDTKEDYKIEVSVMKTGSETSITADATVKVMSKADIAERIGDANHNYEPLPTNLYSLDKTDIHFEAEQRYATIEVKFPASSVQTLREIFAKEADIKANENPDTTFVKHVVALQLVSSTDTVNSYNNYVILTIDDCRFPEYGFASFAQTSLAGKDDSTAPIELYLEVDNKWDFTAKVVKGTEDDVIDYNIDNESEFELLPEDLYELGETAVFKKNGKGAIDLIVRTKQLPKEAAYLLPIKIVADGSTDFVLSEKNSTYYIIVRPDAAILLSRRQWTITGDTEEDTGENGGENGRFWCAIDNDLNTFWHTKWSGDPKPVLPFNLDITMEAKHTIQRIGLINRQGCPWDNHPSGIFSVSVDGETWEQVGTFTLNEVSEEEIFDVDMEKATDVKYLRVTFTTVSHGDTDTCLSEIKAYGY